MIKWKDIDRGYIPYINDDLLRVEEYLDDVNCKNIREFANKYLVGKNFSLFRSTISSKYIDWTLLISYKEQKTEAEQFINEIIIPIAIIKKMNE